MMKKLILFIFLLPTLYFAQQTNVRRAELQDTASAIRGDMLTASDTTALRNSINTNTSSISINTDSIAVLSARSLANIDSINNSLRPDINTNTANILSNLNRISGLSDSTGLNTAHRLTTTGNPHNVLATQITDFDTEVSNNSSVTALQDTTTAHNLRLIDLENFDLAQIDSNTSFRNAVGVLQDSLSTHRSDINTNTNNISINVDSIAVLSARSLANAGSLTRTAYVDSWTLPEGGVMLNGTSQRYGLIDYTDVQSLSFIVNNLSLTTTEQLLYLGANSLISSVSGVLTLGSAFTNTTVYINNNQTTSLQSGVNLIIVDFDSLDISTGYIGYDGTNYGAFDAIGLNFWNTQSDSELRKNLWNNGQPDKAIIPYEYRDASNIPTYESDFTIGVDAWGTTRSVITGNVDAVSDGVISKDDCLKMYANADNSTHKLNKSIINNAKFNRIEFDYYIPDDNTNVDGMYIYIGDNLETPTTLKDVFNGDVVVGEWSHLALTFNANALQSRIFISMLAESNAVFSGANLPTDDLIYFKNVLVNKQGEVASFKNNSVGTNGWVCKVGGELSVANSSGSPIPLSNEADGRQGVSTSEVVLTNTQKANTVLKGIYVIEKSGSSNTYSIGTSTGTYNIASAVSISANTTVYIPITTSTLNFASVTRSLYVKAGASSLTFILDYEDMQ